jgi:similar to spore coat protein
MNILQSMAGMADMTEQVIAMDFLLNAKTAVMNYSIAISKATTPEVRETLRRHLDASITTHERILKYMMNHNYYHVHNPQEQMIVDRKASNTALNLQ